MSLLTFADTDFRGETDERYEARKAAKERAADDYAMASSNAIASIRAVLFIPFRELPPGVTIPTLQKAATLLKKRNHPAAAQAARVVRRLKVEREEAE